MKGSTFIALFLIALGVVLIATGVRNKAQDFQRAVTTTPSKGGAA